jgi:Family of unknown function (DUF6261)
MITGITLNNMRNAEFIQFIKNCLAITQSNDPAILNVQVQHDDLLHMLVLLEGLFVTEQGSAVTEEVSALDLRRDRAISGFSLLVNAYTYYFDPVIAKHAETLNRQIAQYGGGIARENYQAESAIIDNLLADLNSKPELGTAITALHLKDWKNELEAANTAFNDAYLVRTKQLGAATKDRLLAKRQETNEAYYKLRDFINSYYTINNGAAPYGKTTDELNALIDQYNTMMAARLNNGKEEPPVVPPVS